jgi:dTMP kinase
VETYRERYNVVGLFENRVFPGIRRLMRTLRQEGWYIGIATGKPQLTSERVVAHFGLDKFVTKICGPTGDHRADKIDLIKNALPEGWNAETDDIWMVGDRKFDVEGAIGAGVKSIGVGYGYGSEEELRTAGCTQYCETVQDVIDFLCPGAKAPEGAFLSVEGLDGSGKGTQIRLLCDVIDRFGFELVQSREPGGCPISEKIRDIVLDKHNAEMDDITEVILYAASRAQHVREVIRPAIAAGKVMLCDRFVDSSVAYQGGGRQLGVQRVLDINAPAVDGTLPMATVYLDVDHQTSLKRRAAATELDRMELEGDSFHADNGKKEQVIQGTTHVYTHKEFDPALDAVQTMFDVAGLSWVLTSVLYEDETNTIHYEWTWETGGKNG